jgi:hypothetical protein
VRAHWNASEKTARLLIEIAREHVSGKVVGTPKVWANLKNLNSPDNPLDQNTKIIIAALAVVGGRVIEGDTNILAGIPKK